MLLNFIISVMGELGGINPRLLDDVQLVFQLGGVDGGLNLGGDFNGKVAVQFAWLWLEAGMNGELLLEGAEFLAATSFSSILALNLAVLSSGIARRRCPHVCVIHDRRRQFIGWRKGSEELAMLVVLIKQLRRFPLDFVRPCKNSSLN